MSIYEILMVILTVARLVFYAFRVIQEFKGLDLIPFLLRLDRIFS